MIANSIAWVGLVSTDVEAAAAVFARHLGLPRKDLDSGAGPVPAFAIGRSALALFAPGHPLVEDDPRPGVHHVALAAEDPVRAAGAAAAAGVPAAGGPRHGLGGGRCVALEHNAAAGVRLLLAEPPALPAHTGGPLRHIDHLGVASTDVFEDERIFAAGLGFAVESRQTDMEVRMAVESFTSDRYGVVYHTREPEPVGGLRVCFITVGDCEFEFLANFDPRHGAGVDRGQPGNTKQDQGAIARFVHARGRGLHHIALRTGDIDATLAALAAAGLPMIDARGRPGSRRARIGFMHPRALGGVLMHFVERPDAPPRS